MIITLDNKKNIINFHFQPRKSLLNSWAITLKVCKFSNVKIFGVVTQKTKLRWELVGQLSFEVFQECVVTLDPVATHINCEIKRVYVEPYCPTNSQNSFNSLEELEYEPLENSVDLETLIFEELSLNTPEYPKLDHIDKLHKVRQSSQTQNAPSKNNPFSILKNFEAKNKVKYN